MAVKLKLSCGGTQEVFDLRPIDWTHSSLLSDSEVVWFTKTFVEIIDSYQTLIKNELERKHPDISLKYPGVDDKEIEEYGWDMHLYHEHMIKLWRWVALHPRCNVRTVEE